VSSWTMRLISSVVIPERSRSPTCSNVCAAMRQAFRKASTSLGDLISTELMSLESGTLPGEGQPGAPIPGAAKEFGSEKPRLRAPAGPKDSSFAGQLAEHVRLVRGGENAGRIGGQMEPDLGILAVLISPEKADERVANESDIEPFDDAERGRIGPDGDLDVVVANASLNERRSHEAERDAIERLSADEIGRHRLHSHTRNQVRILRARAKRGVCAGVVGDIG